MSTFVLPVGCYCSFCVGMCQNQSGLFVMSLHGMRLAATKDCNTMCAHMITFVEYSYVRPSPNPMVLPTEAMA